MDRILKALFQIHEFKLRSDDDFVDRLNRQHTPTMLALFTVLVSIKQYVGEPIDCWCPAQFTSSQMAYTDTVCWVSDTYYVPFNRGIPKLGVEPRKMISYYQWVPLLLLGQACLFFVPCIVWRFLNKRSGLSLPAVMEAGVACQRAIYVETREKTVRYMVSQIDGYLMVQRSYKKGCCSRLKHLLAQHCCLFCGKLYGNYLTCTYLLVKLLYMFNAVAQLFVLDRFLGMNSAYHFYGLAFLWRKLQGYEWSASERFPRVTWCDFQIRQQINVHRFVRPDHKNMFANFNCLQSKAIEAWHYTICKLRYTVQCVLPINLFNEKIFLFLWFWLFFLTFMNLSSFIHWCSKLLILPMQVSFVKRQLKAMDFHKRETKTASKFTQCYLRRDGLLIVRLIGKNAGHLVAAELLHGLWTNYGPDRRSLAESQGEGPAGASAAASPRLCTNELLASSKSTWTRAKDVLLGKSKDTKIPHVPCNGDINP